MEGEQKYTASAFIHHVSVLLSFLNHLSHRHTVLAIEVEAAAALVTHPAKVALFTVVSTRTPKPKLVTVTTRKLSHCHLR